MKKYILVGANAYTEKLLTIIPSDEVEFIWDANHGGMEMAGKKIYSNIDPDSMPKVLEMFEFVLVSFRHADVDYFRNNKIPFLFAPELLLQRGIYDLGTHQAPKPDIYPYPIMELMNTYGRNEFAPVSDEEYAEFAKSANRYKKIVVGVMHPTSIGGFGWTCGRICEYMETTKGEDTLQAVCKGWHSLMGTVKKYEVPNEYIYKKMKEMFPTVNETNVNLWCTYICRNMDKLQVIDYNGALTLTKTQAHEFFSTPGLAIPRAKPPKERITFTMEEQRKGEELAHGMGITRNFVCIFARDNAYIRTTHRGISEEDFKSEEKYRNSDINKFSLMASNLERLGMQSVRMGSIVSDKYTGPGVDYSNINQSDFMDTYLFSQCRFAVLDISGITTVPTELFSKPIVATHTPTIMVYHGDIAGLYHIIVFRKVYSRTLKKNLSLRELMKPCEELNYYIYNFNPYWNEQDIEIIPESQEEIWEAAEEMYNILNGTQKYTKADLELRERYRSLIWEHLKRSPDLDALQGYPSISWLRKNQWFLE